MSVFLLIKLVHVASAMWLVGGLFARFLALGAASRSGEIRTTQALTELAGKFENRMVIPASITLLVTGILAALVGGFPLLGPVQGGPWWLLVSLLLYLASIVLVPTVFLPRGRVFGAALDDALARNEVTPGLRTAFADRVVARSHWAEFIGIAVIVVLMVLKPF
jgi:uncharacterized membrane protein